MKNQQKIIGLIGGMSWESTKVYYEHLNTLVNERLGGSHSARILLSSVDFAEIEALSFRGEWNAIGAMMAEHAQKLERAGAEMLLLGTNTIHLISPQIEAAVTIPFIHIAHTTGAAVADRGIKKVGLLGTRFTMEKDFYSRILKDQYGLEVIVPSIEGRQRIHDIIYNELVKGIFSKESEIACLDLITSLHSDGAQGIILGCTELPLLMAESLTEIPLFDTTRLHAAHAVNLALHHP